VEPTSEERPPQRGPRAWIDRGRGLEDEGLRRVERRALSAGGLLIAALFGVGLVAPRVDPAVRLAILAVLLLVAVLALLRLQRGARTALDTVLQRHKSAALRWRADDLAKGRLLANLGHEIRAPMHGILGMAELLLHDDLTADQRQHVELIHTSAEALLALANDVLDLARLEAERLRLRPRDVLLRRVADDVLRLLAPQAAERRVELGLRVGEEVPDELRADPVRLRQVLLNLVGNAVRFTRQGSVTVEVGREPGDAAPPMLRFAVRDTGVGIRPEAQARLFQPFAQADSSDSGARTGSGLGLVISKSIVELMGGEIGFESVRGVGSTFWFRVPLEPARGDASPPDEEAPAGAALRCARGERRVLVVDDRSVNRTVALALLVELGYRADAAAGGEEALAKLEQGGFDAVLLDCDMPGLDGFETCRRLRQREAAEAAARRLPVIAVTAHTRPEDSRSCLAAGMDDHLGKPFRSAELAAVLDHRFGIAVTPPGEDSFSARLAALRHHDETTGEATVATFLACGEEDLASLRRALADSDAEALATIAHALAGSAGMLGAGELAARASGLASRARDGDLGRCAECLPALEREWSAVAARLRS